MRFYASGVPARGAYNAEIDGLRAIAVLSVLLFHFDFTQFSGGFVGVDIFFVISGFLITRLILDETDSGHFSFKRFYLRRTRRLFPALFATLLATFIAAILIFTPEDLEKLSGSLVYALLSASNIFFWREAGYFDTAAILKPILHTWSLSVEEQFYLIWPALLVLGSRFAKRLIPALIAMLGLASLVLSELTLAYSTAAAFYWMPLRIFEFSIGALLYWTQTYRLPKHLGSDLLGLIGLSLIAYCIHSLDKTSRFPGLLALLPCIGAACVIQAGPSRILGHILCLRPLVAVGLISYSLYLVHWPLVVFLKYTQGTELSELQKALLLISSFVCATLLYKTVEKPLRYTSDSKIEHSNTGFALCCALLALILTLPAADAWANRGWSWRFSEVGSFLSRYDINNKDYVWELWRKLEASPNRKSRLYIIGDSQAADMLNAIHLSGALHDYDLPPRVHHVQYFCGAVVVPASELDRFYGEENTLFRETKARRDICEKQRNAAFSIEALKSSDLIILSPYWSPYLVKRLPHTLEYIRAISLAKIIVVGQKHMLASSTAIFNKHRSLKAIETAAAKFIDPETIKMNSHLAVIAAKQRALFYNPLNALCDADISCHVVGDQGGPITFDTHHLTPEGAALVGSHFKSWLTQNTSSVGL